MKRHRKRRQREGEPSIHTNFWVLRFDKPSGESGYFTFIGESELFVRREIGGTVQRFRTHQDAQRCLRSLQRRFGFDIEEATIEEFVHDQKYALWLDDSQWPDGISVEQDEKTGKQYLLIREHGEEFTSDDLDDNVADAMVRVLEKLDRRLRRSKSK